MNNTSKELFKKSMDKAFSQPGMTINKSTMTDNMNYKQSFKEQDELEGGVGDEMTLKKISKIHRVSLSDLVDEFSNGVDVEKEHTDDLKTAMEIAMDHLSEDPHYYTKLKKLETKEQLVVKSVSKKEMKKIIDRAENEWEKEPKKKVTAKSQFSKDLQQDKDFEEFKKNAKYNVRGVIDTYGVPNVSSEDPYIKKNTKYGRPGRGKEEATEATSSGSSGAFSGPIAFKDSEFLRKSFSETPKKLKEGLTSGAIGLDKVEAKEATTSGSVGGYESPSMWAKSTKKKDWGPSRKTQVPGGSFVKVKKKCTKFPYCNQGDINALILSKNESVKEAIENVSKKYNIGKNVIINILENEYIKLIKRKN